MVLLMSAGVLQVNSTEVMDANTDNLMSRVLDYLQGYEHHYMQCGRAGPNGHCTTLLSTLYAILSGTMQ